MATLPASNDWLTRAKEARQLAVTIHDPDTQDQLLRIALAYEMMARRAAMTAVRQTMAELQTIRS